MKDAKVVAVYQILVKRLKALGAVVEASLEDGIFYVIFNEGVWKIKKIESLEYFCMGIEAQKEGKPKY